MVIMATRISKKVFNFDLGGGGFELEKSPIICGEPINKNTFAMQP